MSFLGKLFGREPKPSKPDPRNDPNLIQVFDKYGREMFITKEQWRKDVLPGALRSEWSDPDRLYAVIVGALNDGFRADVVDAARRLQELEPNAVRSACLWGIVLMEEGRLDEAEKTFRDFMAKNGEQGVVLTNLAKVYARRKDDAKAEEILWRALQADPNQENGLGWYFALHRDRGGDSAGQAALRRLAALPGGWRAQLWLARAALKDADLAAALAFYRDSLARAGKPAPADLLQQMSGDLGIAGRLREVLELVEPLFDAKVHGLQVGNNLIKAHVDLGEFDAARSLLDKLYALDRLDFKQGLQYWDTEIARARTASAPEQKVPLDVAMLTIDGPVWLKPSSPAAGLFQVETTDTPLIAFLGSAAKVATNSKRIVIQIANPAGRLSRALPLFLAEQVQFAGRARVRTLLPWVRGKMPGFVLSGAAWADEAAAGHARQNSPDCGLVVTAYLQADDEPWKVDLRLIRTSDGRRLGELTSTFPSDKWEDGIPDLARRLTSLLAETAKVGLRPLPSSYRIPQGPACTDYLLRLEQLLALRCAGMDGVPPTFLNGEREMLEGGLLLSLSAPDNANVRLLFTEMALAMKRVRPEIMTAFKERVALLQKDRPLPEPSQGIVQATLDEAFGS